MHKRLRSSQTGTVQALQVGSSPMKTLANEDLPIPVEPSMMICGSGSESELAIGKKLTLNLNVK